VIVCYSRKDKKTLGNDLRRIVFLPFLVVAFLGGLGER